jgi:hypothetical protein
MIKITLWIIRIILEVVSLVELSEVAHRFSTSGAHFSRPMYMALPSAKKLYILNLGQRDQRSGTRLKLTAVRTAGNAVNSFVATARLGGQKWQI